MVTAFASVCLREKLFGHQAILTIFSCRSPSLEHGLILLFSRNRNYYFRMTEIVVREHQSYQQIIIFHIYYPTVFLKKKYKKYTISERQVGKNILFWCKSPQKYSLIGCTSQYAPSVNVPMGCPFPPIS